MRVGYLRLGTSQSERCDVARKGHVYQLSSPMIVQQETRQQHNGRPKGSTSPAQDSTLSASSQCPSVQVSNMTLDFSTGVVATVTSTQDFLCQCSCRTV
ncbi:TPA: hypothetical protein ACH3X3_013008 [Trebouxia sp. C0006]